MPRLQQHTSQTEPLSQPSSNSHYHETLAMLSSVIRRDIDQFLVALPLGTGPDDAILEEAIASKLY